MIKKINREKLVEFYRSDFAFKLLLIAVSTICTAPFWPVLTLPFLADDFDFIFFMEGFDFIKQLEIFSTLGDVYFRPFGLLFWRLDYIIWNKFAPGYHLTNIMLHICASVMLALLVYRINSSRIQSLGVGALFAAYPLHVEPIAFITARFALMSTFLVTWTLYLYIGSPENGKKGFALSLLTALAAYLSKEDAFILPGLLLAANFLFMSNRIETKSAIYRWTAHLMLAIAAFIFRARVLPKAIGYQDTFGNIIDPITSLRSQGVMSFINILKLHLAPISKNDFIIFDNALLVFCAVFLVLFLLSATSIKRNFNVLSFGLLWLVLGVVPILPFFYMGDWLESSRYIYLATAGFIIFLSTLAFGVNVGCQVKSEKVRIIVGVLTVLAYGYFSFINLAPYKRAGRIISTVHADAKVHKAGNNEKWIYMGLPIFIDGVLIYPTDHTLLLSVLLASNKPLHGSSMLVVRKDIISLEAKKAPRPEIPLSEATRIIEWDNNKRRIIDRTGEVRQRLLEKRDKTAKHRALPSLRIPAGPDHGTPMQPTNQVKLIGPGRRGMWKYIAMGEDPFFRSPLMKVDSLMVKEIQFKMSLSPRAPETKTSDMATLMFRPSNVRDFLPKNKIEFMVVSDGKIHDYTLRVNQHPSWLLLGTLSELRLDPINRPGEISLGDIYIIPYNSMPSR